MKKKLNIGCGKDIIENAVNLDYIDGPGVDVVFDLNNLKNKKLPFKDETFDEIFAHHIIEHLDNPEIFIKELSRVCKHKGIIHIRTPHYTSNLSYGDLTHKRAYSSIAFLDYDYGKSHMDQTKTLENPDTVLFYVDCNIIFGRLHRLFGISFIANKIPQFYENFFCFLFPARELWFDLTNLKKEKLKNE